MSHVGWREQVNLSGGNKIKNVKLERNSDP